MTDTTPRIPSQFIAPVDMPTVERPAGSPPPVDMPTWPEQHDQVPDDAPERDAEAAAATPAAAAPDPDAPAKGPVPMAAGTYAVYDDQNGGYVLVIGTREGETHHKHIPARIVKMAEMAMGGNSPFGAMFGDC